MTHLTTLLALTLSVSYAGTLSNQVFNFTGTCSDCTGTGTATLTVSNNYVVGTPFQNSDLISFHYQSNLLDVTILPTDRLFNHIGGTMPVGLGAADITVEGDFIFTTKSDGSWSVGVDDIGTNGLWSQPGVTSSAPEPATWLSLGIGLAALTRLRRRG